MQSEFKRNLIKFSNYSLCVTLPKNITDQMNWKKGDTIKISFDEKVKKLEITKEDQKLKKVIQTFEKTADQKKNITLAHKDEPVKNTHKKEIKEYIIFSRDAESTKNETTLRW